MPAKNALAWHNGFGTTAQGLSLQTAGLIQHFPPTANAKFMNYCDKSQPLILHHGVFSTDIPASLVSQFDN